MGILQAFDCALVRFDILEAGAYGVSQSRKRAFIWAASPDEILPEWPKPMHVFSAPELEITLSEKTQYAAVRSTACGAPFRSITVRDTIGDLPEVGNGACKTNLGVYKIVKSSTGTPYHLVIWSQALSLTS